MKQTEMNVILAQLKTTHMMDQAMDGSHSAEWAMRKFSAKNYTHNGSSSRRLTQC